MLLVKMYTIITALERIEAKLQYPQYRATNFDSLPTELLEVIIVENVKNRNTIASTCSIFGCSNELLKRVWQKSFGSVHAYMDIDIDVQAIDKETIIRRKLESLEVGKTKSGKQMYKLWDKSWYVLTRDKDSDDLIFETPLSMVGGHGFTMVHSSELPEGFQNG